MQDFARSIIQAAAEAAGLAPAMVIDIVAKDNLTIARPRAELEFLPERYSRSGKALAIWRENNELTTKRELYTVTLPVNVNVFADDDGWLAAFGINFVAALPRGGNDPRGNWVKITTQEATFGRDPDKRVGDAVIKVFNKINKLFVVDFEWRLTTEQSVALIPNVTITPKIQK